MEYNTPKGPTCPPRRRGARFGIDPNLQPNSWMQGLEDLKYWMDTFFTPDMFKWFGYVINENNSFKL